MTSLALVLGIRPDIIRASLVVKQLKQALGDRFLFVWSGQHYSQNLKDVFFHQLQVPTPDIELAVSGATDSEFIGSIITQLGKQLDTLDVAATVFLGDTNTVMGAIAAASRNIPIVHVEGCMRSYDWRMPEEKYRTVIDHLSDRIYAYLPEYKEQGILEGLRPETIMVTGNPIVDVLEEYFLSGKARMSSDDVNLMKQALQVSGQPYLLMTCHRRENVESAEALAQIFRLVETSGRRTIFPAGYRTQRMISNFALAVPENVYVMDPIGYTELLELAVGSQGVLTDSGTVVEECAVLGVPSIQMRTSTERPQVYDCGSSLRFDPHRSWSNPEMQALLSALFERHGKSWDHGLGDGHASERMAIDLISRFEAQEFDGHSPDLNALPASRNYGTGITKLGDFASNWTSR